jgi:hypothetical protein
LDLNQTQIDEYHRIATDQADRSFRSSQRAMALGLLVIVGCFAAGLYFTNGQPKVFVGAIAGVAAALSAFLNRTYLQMYGQTLSQLNRYFEQPVLTGYYLGRRGHWQARPAYRLFLRTRGGFGPAHAAPASGVCCCRRSPGSAGAAVGKARPSSSCRPPCPRRRCTACSPGRGGGGPASAGRRVADVVPCPARRGSGATSGEDYRSRSWSAHFCSGPARSRLVPRDRFR